MSKKKNKSGFSLSEVLMSVLIIAVLAIGGSAALYQTGSSVIIQGHKRVALEIANQRLELAMSNYYYDIVPGEYDEDNTYYLNPVENASDILEVITSNTPESITIGGISYEMTTKVLRHSQAGGTVGFQPEALQVTVTVEYRSTTGEAVELTTLLIPPEVTG
jgi:prepilin-type N-terminal cleavage/methylation domain-containing protein